MLNIEEEAKAWVKKKEGEMPSKLIIKYDFKYIILLIHLYLILVLLLVF